jgi:hypothetical protein
MRRKNKENIQNRLYVAERGEELLQELYSEA